MTCGVAGVAAAFGLFGGTSNTVIAVVAMTAVGSMITGIRRQPGYARPGWILILMASLLSFVASGLRESLHTLGNITASRSLVPDLFSGPGYINHAVGLMLATAQRRRGSSSLEPVLDSLLAGLAALALAWVFMIGPALAHTNAGILVKLSIVGYPPVSVVFVVITSQLAWASGKRVASLNGAVAAMFFLLVGDAFFTLVDGHIAHVPKAFTSAPYMITYAAITFFSLHPSFAEVGEPVPVAETTPSPARLAYISIALAIIAVTQDRPDLGDRVVLACVILALTIIATWRVLLALRSHARAERTLLHQATHDSLTGTLNRHGLLEEISRWRDIDGHVAMFFLDLDRFKLVNDTFGHSFGDELLLRVSERLASMNEPGSLIARIGGDEFVVVARDVADAAEAVVHGERLREDFTHPFEVEGSEIPVSVSIGIAITGEDPDSEDLLRDADTAMYSAKEAGRDAVVVFDDSMRDRVAQRLELERDLRHALERGELTVYYQPVVTLPAGEVSGFEALLRWHHPTMGTVSPLAFIPIAEETGLITQIGAWVLDEACRQIRAWRRLVPGAERLTMAVNMSARQLRDSDLPFMIDRTMWRHRLEPDALCLELTESMLLENPDAAASMLARLRERGLHLAIDDFGTGYSSLAYLQRFPFDRVKVDRAFVEPLDRVANSDHQLVAAIIAMADALGMSVVAEGVETIEQAERLAEMGCETAQGFYYSRPLPADAMPDALRRLGIAQTSQRFADNSV